jgi:hypothetical protein
MFAFVFPSLILISSFVTYRHYTNLWNEEARLAADVTRGEKTLLFLLGPEDGGRGVCYSWEKPGVIGISYEEHLERV